MHDTLDPAQLDALIQAIADSVVVAINQSTAEDEPQNLLDTLLSYKEFLIPLVTGVFTLALFMAKEYWESRRNKQQEIKQEFKSFKVYGYPLLMALESLISRLQDIFLTQPRYLRSDAPDIEYYQYNYISTLYRLCSVLGWIRAVRLEVASLAVSKDATNTRLEDAIEAFQSALSSNHLSAGAQVSYLAQRWNMEVPKKAQQNEKYQWEKDIEKAVIDYMSTQEVERPHQLPEEDQIELLSRIAHKLCGSLDHGEGVPEELIRRYRTTCISTISRRVSWIYKDWQRAIGDHMLQRQESDGVARRLEIMPFQEFEEAFISFQKEPAKHLYIGRINRLFYNLRPFANDKVDARSQQLIQTSEALLDLITAIRDTGLGTEVVTDDELKEMQLRQKKIQEMREA
ncbi:MAG: hypothetical protein AAFR61_00115 [Bacteroidota bacterium]